MKDIKSMVISTVADQLGVSESRVEPNKSLEDLGADSIDRVEIIMKLEEEFNIEIPEDISDKLKTVTDFAEYIENHKNK